MHTSSPASLYSWYANKVFRSCTGGCRHHHIGASQYVLDHFGCALHAGSGGLRGEIDLSVQKGDPH